MLLLRFAAPTLFGLLFHKPLRRDRLGLWSAPPAKNSTPKNHPPQALRLRVPCVADPALHGGVEILPVGHPAEWPSPQSHEACGQSYGHCRGAVGDDRERRGNPADQYLGHVVEVLWHRPVGHRLKRLSDRGPCTWLTPHVRIEATDIHRCAVGFDRVGAMTS